MDNTETNSGVAMEANFGQLCGFNRSELKTVGESLKRLIDKAKNSPDVVGMDRGEMIANATLAYRHVEDAAMRVGKAIQAYERGYMTQMMQH